MALLLPTTVAAEVDGLRRALGSATRARIAPHVTLVPPVNVRPDAVADGLRVLRDAAAGCDGLRLRLGPPTTFAPTTPTIHLAVVDLDDGPLGELRRRLVDGPFARPPTRPFVPHVTLDDDVGPGRLEASMTALADYVVEVAVDRVHLLEQQRGEGGRRRWVPIADAPFGPRRVVGRGGVELELTVTRLVDPDAAGLLAEVGLDAARDGPDTVVVTARRRGEVVGVVHGRRVEAPPAAPTVVVAEAHRGQGIAGRLLDAFDHAAGRDRAGPA